MKKKYYIILISLIFIVFLALALHKWVSQPYEEIEKKIKNLKTEQAVIDTFGPPNKIFLRGSRDYYIKGYSYKEREITNKVMIYFPLTNTDMVVDIILYIYIDNDGSVEYYFVGGS